jgi:transcriptional regulator
MSNQHTRPKSEPRDIDAALARLLAETPRGVTLTQEQIADACGCTKGYIWLVEKEAMKKLRQRSAALEVFL